MLVPRAVLGLRLKEKKIRREHAQNICGMRYIYFQVKNDHQITQAIMMFFSPSKLKLFVSTGLIV